MPNHVQIYCLAEVTRHMNSLAVSSIKERRQVFIENYLCSPTVLEGTQNKGQLVLPPI